MHAYAVGESEALVGHDIVGIHGRAARSPRISPPGAGGDG
jgi:hypothetical protein